MSLDLSNKIVLLDPEFSPQNQCSAQCDFSECPNYVIGSVAPLTAYTENCVCAHVKPLRGPVTCVSPLWSSSGQPHGISS